MQLANEDSDSKAQARTSQVCVACYSTDKQRKRSTSQNEDPVCRGDSETLFSLYQSKTTTFTFKTLLSMFCLRPAEKGKYILRSPLLLETSRKETGTVVVKIANRSREETDGDSSNDPDARYEGPQVKVIVVDSN